jgi:hypothetical protein
LKHTGAKIDIIIQSYHADVLSRAMAIQQLEPIVYNLNRRQIKRNGSRAKLYNIERMLG